jgi:hypothetical protein
MDVFATLAKFDGTKCNNKVLAMSSYENLLEQGYFQLERYLLSDPMFVLNMEKYGTKYRHKVKSGVKWVVENYKKSEATIKEQTEEIKALKRDNEKLQAKNLEMRGNIERHEETDTVAQDKSEDVPQCNKSEGKRSAATAFGNGRSTHQTSEWSTRVQPRINAVTAVFARSRSMDRVPTTVAMIQLVQTRTKRRQMMIDAIV